MKRHNFILIAVSLILILGLLLAGVYLMPQPGEPQTDATFSLAPSHLSDPANLADAANPEFFTFGDKSGEAIFLQLTDPQANNTVHYTLVGSRPASESAAGQDLHCEVGAPLVSPPPGVSLSVHSATHKPTSWEQFTNWLTATIDRQYAITMWSPSSLPRDYHLVNADDAGITGSCAQLIGEDV